MHIDDLTYLSTFEQETVHKYHFWLLISAALLMLYNSCLINACTGKKYTNSWAKKCNYTLKRGFSPKMKKLVQHFK